MPGSADRLLFQNCIGNGIASRASAAHPLGESEHTWSTGQTIGTAVPHCAVSPMHDGASQSLGKQLAPLGSHAHGDSQWPTTICIVPVASHWKIFPMHVLVFG